MGKPKKGKKGRQDDDVGDDETAVDPIAQAEVVEDKEVVAKDVPKAGKKGKGKKGKRADDDWEEDVSKEIATLSLGKEPEVTNGDADEPKPPSGKSKKKDKKKKQQQKEEEEEEKDDEEEDDMAPVMSKGKSKAGMSAFAMLDIEDVEEEEEEEEVEVMPTQKKNKKNKKGKSTEEEVAPSNDEPEPEPQQTKGGKKEKTKNEEEDIDAILADIEKPAEKPEGKKKKKKKEKLDDFASAASEEPSSGFELVDIESMTQEQIAMLLGGDDDEEDDRKKKKKEKKKKKKGAEVSAVAEEKEEEPKEEGVEKMDETEKEEGGEEEGGTVKTAAQKKKEKRERQKQQKMQEKQKQVGKEASGKKEETEKVEENAAKVPEGVEAQKSDGEEGDDDDDGDKKKSKKDRKKKKGGKEVKEEEEKKKKPGNKQLKAMQEALLRVKEEEEAMRKAEEEKERKLEEIHKAKIEAAAAEVERKEKEKQKKREKIERQKREGTFKTKAQKDAEKRAREMLAARGLEIPARLAGTAPAIPEGGEPKRKRIVYDSRPRRKKQQEVASPTSDNVQSPEAETPTPTIEEKMLVEEAPKEEEKEEEVVDSWELVEEKLNEEEKVAEVKEIAEPVVKEAEKADEEEEESEEEDEESSEEEDEEDSSEEESSSEEDSSEDEDMSPEDRAFHKAAKRIKKRRELAESKRNKDVLRAPVVCVLGHVDTGKTKILDKLRRTNVQDGEAGGITQQIGATNVPRDAIQDKTAMCKEFAKKELKLPGLLIIDTPGHESFSNLRNRGSSLCDIAILVVDIMHGLEPQTIESINLLKSRKTPFVIALNKIDRLFGWKPNPHSDVVNTLKKQTTNTKLEFEERVQMVQVQMAEQGLNVMLFHENKNPREYISMCPTSAHSGDGMGNLVALICELSQSFLAERIAYIDDLQSTVMEVKAIPGLGMTIDVILVNGSLREGSTIVVAGTEGPIVTSIRGLLMPQPMKELRVKGAYIHQKEVPAAQGVKIIAKDLDKALAGLPLYVAKYDDEIAVYRADLEQSLEAILKGIKVQQEGVFVQASTLGSLEALLEFLRTSKIPYAAINIGPVHRRDIMRASVMLERDNQYACVLAFDVKVEREAQEMADNLGVRIFTADIIYHLFDAFTAYRADLKKKKQEEFKFIAVFPCKLRILPNCVFNTRDPIVVGVVVEAGFIKEGTPICVPSKEFLEVGRVTSIENNHKAVDRASKGSEVCIKIEPIPGEAPKLFGRHFDHTDILMSKISRASIDAVKNYFREDMSKNDWTLIKEMKALFEIL